MKDIVNYEGLYAITENGQVWSHKTKRFLKASVQSNGYMKITLYKSNQSKTYTIHRLVAQAFIPNPDNLPEINHKDEDKTNNKVENLEWCDRRYNMTYGKMSNRKRKAVKCIDTGEVFESINSAAKALDLDISSVSKVCRKVMNQTKGYHFEFAEEEK